MSEKVKVWGLRPSAWKYKYIIVRVDKYGMNTWTRKSPAFRAGLLSNKAFVKRDAEPSECECSLGEFIAQVKQGLTHLPALAGRKGSLLAVHYVPVHFLHEPSPALAEVGFGDIAQTDGLGDVAKFVASNQLVSFRQRLVHAIDEVFGGFFELVGRKSHSGCLSLRNSAVSGL